MRLGKLVMDYCVLPLYRAFAIYGSMFVFLPPVDPVDPVGVVDLTGGRRGAAGPPHRHPERLCPELPLSAVEAALAAQLVELGSGYWWTTGPTRS